MAIYVLDSNIIMHKMESIFQFGPHDVIIPITVVNELDDKKRYMDEVGRNARHFFNFYKTAAMLLDDDEEYIPLPNGGRLCIEFNHTSTELFNGILPSIINDNRILAVTVNLHHEEIEKAKADPTYEPQKVTLVTNDGGLFAKARSLKKLLKERKLNGFSVELYESDRVKDIDTLHNGFHEVEVPSWFINKLHQSIVPEDRHLKQLSAYDLLPFLDEVLPSGGQFDNEYFENSVYRVENHAQEVKKYTSLNTADLVREFAKHNAYTLDFFILKSNESTDQSTIVHLINKGGQLLISTLATEFSDSFMGINPLNAQQLMALELLFDPNAKVISFVGGAGTGKTLMALIGGIMQTKEEGHNVHHGNIRDKIFKKMLVARPVVPVGKDLGYLPGEKNDKLRPWMAPIYDNLEFLLGVNQSSEIFNEEVKRLNMEIEALTYIRGRSIPDQFIIIDEAQNLTSHEVKTILTRVGKNSKIILMGDPEQIDHPYLDATNNGLTYVMERMKQVPFVGCLRFIKSERSDVAKVSAELL